MRLEELGKLKKLIHLIGFRTRDLPACGTATQPLRYRVPNYCIIVIIIIKIRLSEVLGADARSRTGWQM
jgi:hypothetical protein